MMQKHNKDTIWWISTEEMYICNQQIEHDQNNRNSFLKNVFFPISIPQNNLFWFLRAHTSFRQLFL